MDPRSPVQAEPLPKASGPSAFRVVPRTGVIYVTTEASKLGFSPSNPDWCNLGQGQPETGPLPGSPERQHAITIHPDDQEYAPVAGLWELREAIAEMYNKLYRRGQKSKYAAENVMVSGGGRAALTRAAASLGQINLGHFLPDYTAYEELLDVFGNFAAIPILLEGDRGYAFSVGDLRKEILGRGLSAILLSNPCNPTGKHVRGEELAAWVRSASELDCALMFDEFYSFYTYPANDSPSTLPDETLGHHAHIGLMESAARYVEDVDRDPVLIFDGLTKNFRYPGWRVTWAIGPKSTIEALSSAGSFLDGGGSKPMQRAAVDIVTADHARAEAGAIQRSFSRKRRLMIDRLRALGVQIDVEPEGTFYVWGSVADLPSSISEGQSFFRAALTQKVITVPGEFFDVNPGKRRAGRPSRFRHHIRFSFGPSEDVVLRALDRLDLVVRDAR